MTLLRLLSGQGAADALGKTRSPRQLGDVRSSRLLGEVRTPRLLGDVCTPRLLGEMRSPRQLGEMRSPRQLGGVRSPRQFGGVCLPRLLDEGLQTAGGGRCARRDGAAARSSRQLAGPAMKSGVHGQVEMEMTELYGMVVRKLRLSRCSGGEVPVMVLLLLSAPKTAAGLGLELVLAPIG
jgi:hypothetical protein